MKIIFLEAVQNLGGSKRSILDIADELQKAGVEVLIVDFWGANEDFKEAISRKKLKFKTLKPTSKPFIINKGNIFTKTLKASRYLYERITYKNEFENIVNDFQPDYVCVNSFKTLDILSNKSSYKIDYYIRGWNIGNSFKANMLLKKYKPRFIVVSEATKHAIHLQNKIPLDKIKTVKTGFKEEQFDILLQEENCIFSKDKPILLMHAGTFVKTKGHHIAILVAKALKEQKIHFKLKLAGLITISDDSIRYYNKLKEMVLELDLIDEIEFIVDNKNLANEMNKIDVFIYPSYTEGLPRVCLEAMSKGKPVIANPVGGIVDLITTGYAGYLTDFNNIDDYTFYIIKYYTNPMLYRDHSFRSVDIINSSYLLDSLSKSLLMVYKQNDL